MKKAKLSGTGLNPTYLNINQTANGIGDGEITNIKESLIELTKNNDIIITEDIIEKETIIIPEEDIFIY